MKKIVLFIIGLIISIGIDLLIFYTAPHDVWFRLAGTPTVIYLFIYGCYKIGKSYEVEENEVK